MGTLWRRLVVEPARPETIAARANAHWLVVGTVCIGAFMGQLDASIVTLALPALRRDFHAGIGAVEWVALAYLLTLVSTVIGVGRYADMVGRKLLYTYGFGVFVVGSALCAAAPSLGLLIAARVIQAAGAAMLQANSVALVTQAMPAGMLGRGVGVQGAAQAAGLAMGPAVGGLLVGAWGWRLIFLVNVPVGVAGLVLGRYLLPRSRNLQARRRFDWTGATLFAGGVVLLMVGLSLGTETGWTAPLVLVSLPAGAALTALFALQESRARAPMVDLALLRRRTFSAGIGAGLLSYLVLFGVLFVVPFYLETKRGMSAPRAGLELAVLPLALALAAPLAGRASDRAGPRLVTAAGMGVAVVALVALALLRRPEPLLLLELALLGAGLGMFTPANNAAIMGSAPRTHHGVAGGVLNMTRGLGTSLGVALTAVVYTVAEGGARAGGRPAPAASTHGFAASMALLAVMAALAAVLAGARGGVTPVTAPPAA